MEKDGQVAMIISEPELFVVAAALFTCLQSVTSNRPPGLDPAQEMMKKELRIGVSLFEAMVTCGTKLARPDDDQLIRAMSQVKNHDEVCGSEARPLGDITHGHPGRADQARREYNIQASPRPGEGQLLISAVCAHLPGRSARWASCTNPNPGASSSDLTLRRHQKDTNA